MCGIAGEIRFDGQPVSEDRLRRMGKTISHRGPDGEGIWINDAHSVGLVHRRLALVDLSPTGAQPMANHDGTVMIVFNGEIYNYQELRKDLIAQGVTFRSTSDTEVMLALYDRHGEKMLSFLRGMFAFALWDAKRQKLFFARDRLGKKPFFYQSDKNHFVFASEIKALTIGEKPRIDWLAVRTFIGLQYVPSPQTGFEGIASLPPAHCGRMENGEWRIERYDDAPRLPKFDGSFEDAASHVRHLIDESVHLRMIADVPVGAFLSGGMDSSILVALMARASREPVQTFTMGFPSFGFDERAEARQLAKQLGTEHHEFEARSEQVTELVDQLVDLYDAPYADSSGLPTWLLAKETRRSVKAVITGDGGDELFGGYRRYQFFLLAARLRRWHLHTVLAPWMEVAGRHFHDPRAIRFGRMLRHMHSFADGYATLFSGSYFSSMDEGALLQPEFTKETEHAGAKKFIVNTFQESLGIEGALEFDRSSYLPDDLNVKMDRATMAHGLESRVPFLDQELVKFVARLPLSFVLQRGKQKPLLARAFRDMIPREVFDRPKRGFQVPLAEWFRKDLRPMFVERCLSHGSPLRRVCQPTAVKRYLEENDRGTDHGNRLWMLLVLATWLGRHS